MPRSLQAQMTRRAISPRLAMRIFLNGPDAKEGFSVFDRLTVLDELALDDAGDVGFDLVHELHRFDDAENVAGCDMLADTHERRRFGRGGLVESANDGAFGVEELRARFGGRCVRSQSGGGCGGRSGGGLYHNFRGSLL